MGADAALSRECPDDLPEFAWGANGLEADSRADGVQAHLLLASSEPHKGRDNDWTIALTDDQGDPLDGFQVTWACSDMPIQGHRHPLHPRSVDPVDGEVGQFAAEDVWLSMAGFWEVRFWVDPADGTFAPFAPTLPQSCTPPAPRTGQADLTFKICVPDD